MRAWGRLTVAAWAAVCLAAGGAPADTGPVRSAAWKAGDGWHLTVQLHPPREADTAPPTPTAAGAGGVPSYDLHAIVTGTQVIDGTDCWKIDFIPIRAPTSVSGPYRLWVGKEDGRPRRLLDRKTNREIQLDPTRGAAALAAGPVGLPLELFPLRESADAAGFSVRLSRPPQSDYLRAEATATVDGKLLAIRQEWRDGDNWWTGYERRRDGRLELSARLVPPRTPPIAPRTVEASGLGADPRLQVKLSGNLDRPTVAAVLDRLSEATGLALTADMGSDAAEPAFTGLSLSETPAWQVMDELARSALVEGHWERTADGYGLIRNERFPRTVPPEPPWRPSPFQRILIGAVALLAVGIAVRRLGRHRRLAPAR